MRRINRRILIVLVPVLIILAIIGWGVYRYTYSPTRTSLLAWFTDPSVRPSLTTKLTAPCPGAPFLLPTSGFIGVVYADGGPPYSPLNAHPGIDIFADGEPGTEPVYAAYDGYLTRLADWKSAVIIRIPKDPLDPTRQIWTYYAHMASESGDESYIDPKFPPGTSEKFVKQGEFIGYQGLYNGATNGPRIKTHLHFSVVLSDEVGSFRNEARFNNTLDPSPYLGMTLNAARALTVPARCGT